MKKVLSSPTTSWHSSHSLTLLSAFCLFTFSAFAQTVAGLSGLTGTVRDQTGASIPGAQVIVANESKGIRRTLESNASGAFNAPSLPPATGYSLTVSKDGFAKYEVKDFTLQVGQTGSFNAILGLASTMTSVEVNTAAPLVSDTNVGVSQVVESIQIANLPINGRRADSFVLLTPAVTNDGEFGLVSFRGIAGGNAFLTDGNDTTNSFYNENAGRTRISSQISQDAVQEFQVLSNGFSAEFGRAHGGVINTVTKSGTNSTHGTFFWFFRNRTLNATDRYANGVNAPEWRHQTGGTLGGAIKKDKVFYFLNGEFVRRNFPAQNRIINTQFTDASGNNITAACTATAAQCATATAFIRRQMNVLVPRTVRSDMGLGKIDWRPNEKDNFSFSVNAMHWRSPHGIQTQAVLTNGNALGGNADSTVETRYGKMSWTRIISATSVNEFRFGWFKDRLADPSASDLSPVETGPLAFTLNGTPLGSPSQYPRVLPSEQRFQFVDGYSWTKGSHSIKVGIDLATTQDFNNQLSNRFGTYAYASLTNFARDFSGNTTGLKNYTTFTQTFGNPILDFRTTDTALYFQDVWKVNRKLTFNYGLRYEYTKVPQPTITNPDYPQTGIIHSSPTQFGPRASLAYSVSEKTVIRAGYGIFHARFHGAALNTFFLTNGKYQANYSLTPTDGAAPVFPNILSSVAGSAGTISLEFADPKFRMPYTQQGNLSVEHQFGKNLALTTSYIWSRGVALTTVRDLNIGPLGNPVTYSILDAAGAQQGTFSTPVYLLANRVDKRYRSIYQAENGARSWYNGLAIQVRKPFSHGFFGSASYTWSHAIDNANQGGASDNLFISNARSTFNGDANGDRGSSVTDQRHRAVLNFLYAPKLTNSTAKWARFVVNGWQLSAITTLASAHPSPATINVTAALPGLANNTTLNGFFGSTRVPFLRFNPLDIDQIYRVDARMQRELPFTERVKGALIFEAFNAFNTITNTAVNQQAFTAATGVIRPTANVGLGNSSQGFPDGTNARRMQVALRLTF